MNNREVGVVASLWKISRPSAVSLDDHNTPVMRPT